jgi:hypothetical protein
MAKVMYKLGLSNPSHIALIKVLYYYYSGPIYYNNNNNKVFIDKQMKQMFTISAIRTNSPIY